MCLLVCNNMQPCLQVYGVNTAAGTYCKELGVKAVLNVHLLLLFEVFAFDVSLKLPLGLIH